MTTEDRAARLAEIAHRMETEPSTWISSGPVDLPKPDVFISSKWEIRWLLAELASADGRAKEMVGLLREAARDLANMDGPTTCCAAISGRPHKPDCLVTRLRTAADHAAKDRTDG